MSTPGIDDLARFQAALLELLARELPPEEIIRRLREDTAFAPYRSYVETFEPRFLEVASALVKKWGVREAGTSVGYTESCELELPVQSSLSNNGENS